MDTNEKFKTPAFNWIYNSVDKWTSEHIDLFFTLLSAGIIFCGISLIEHVIARGVFLGNKKTLQYIQKMRF